MKTSKESFFEALNAITPKGVEREYIEIQTNLNEGSLGVSIKLTYNIKEQDHIDRWVQSQYKTDAIINVDIRDIGESKNYWGETHTYREIEYTMRLK